MALVTDGLIGWWNASEQDGSTWPDLSGNGHDLSVANADWQSDGGIPYLRSDQGDGTKATSSDAAFQLGSGARSLCVWTKYPAGSVADNRGIAGKMSESSPYPGWGLVWNGNGYVVAHIIQDAGSTIMTVTRSSTPDTSWHMVALTYDGSYLKLYYDGSLVGTSGAHTYDTDNAKDFAICGLGSAQSTGVCGNVRAALVYDTCLSATDVSDNYAAGPDPPAVYHGETPIVDGDYTVISFLASGDFVTPDGVTTVRALRVGGGSAGAKGTPGTCYGGAGAGGGVVEDTSDVSVSGT
ncbi:MAG: LamG-like jellyroll fold domain-containing protein, partial [Actinomycetes bacterium]